MNEWMNERTKYEVTNFTHSSFISTQFLLLATVHIYTKMEVSIFTHFRQMGVSNFKKVGHLTTPP